MWGFFSASSWRIVFLVKHKLSRFATKLKCFLQAIQKLGSVFISQLSSVGVSYHTKPSPEHLRGLFLFVWLSKVWFQHVLTSCPSNYYFFFFHWAWITMMDGWGFCPAVMLKMIIIINRKKRQKIISVLQNGQRELRRFHRKSSLFFCLFFAIFFWTVLSEEDEDLSISSDNHIYWHSFRWTHFFQFLLILLCSFNRNHFDSKVRLFVPQMDPVQKAVINHTFGVPQPLKKKQIISCNICHLRFNSTVRLCVRACVRVSAFFNNNSNANFRFLVVSVLFWFVVVVFIFCMCTRLIIFILVSFSDHNF